MYGQFIREIPENVEHNKTWQCLSKCDLKVGTEALYVQHRNRPSGQTMQSTTSIRPVKALCVDYVKKNLKVCNTCGRENLAQKEYKRRHDNMANEVQWDFCKKNGLEHTEEWYEHIPEGIVENENVKVLWDINVQRDNVIEARRPDIIVINKKERKGTIIDILVPADVRVWEKEREKVEITRISRTSDRSPWKCHQRI